MRKIGKGRIVRAFATLLTMVSIFTIASAGASAEEQTTGTLSGYGNGDTVSISFVPTPNHYFFDVERSVDGGEWKYCTRLMNIDPNETFTKLKVGSTYSYRVVGTDITYGPYTYTAVQPVPAAEPVAAGTFVLAINGNVDGKNMALAWTAVPGATSYEAQIKVDKWIHYDYYGANQLSALTNIGNKEYPFRIIARQNRVKLGTTSAVTCAQ